MQKTIQINPDFLQVSRKRHKKKKGGKNKEHTLKANDIKKQLLKKIKEHQVKSQQVLQNENKKKKEELELDDNFRASVNFLNTVTKEKKEKKKRKKQRKTQSAKHLKDDPPYGVLKGGKKPLYREYMKTLKKTDKPSEQSESTKITIHDKKEKKDDEFGERQKKLKKFRTKIKKRNFTIGKNMKKRRVGVLIKNVTVKKMIEAEKIKLKGEHIHDVKKYLRNHGLIRVGTTAPEDITRKIFEDANAAGKVFNRSPEILLHNYLNETT